MRLSRKQVEAMAEAAQDTAADAFVLELDADGKVRFGAVEVIEKIRPLALTGKPVGRPRKEASLA